MEEKILKYLNLHGAKINTSTDFSQATMTKIGAGDYNINYHIHTPEKDFVFRLNIESQSGLPNQIKYEYDTLKFLESAHIAPRPYFLDDSKTYFPYGLLIEEFLPGTKLVFSIDSVRRTAKILATLHQLPIGGTEFMKWEDPLQEQYNQATDDLSQYKKRKALNHELVKKCEEMLKKMSQEIQSPTITYVSTSLTHTDPNPANFIDNGEKVFLLDWEKGRIDDPSYDIALFFCEMLNLWDSPRILTDEEKKVFLETYISETQDEDIEKRVKPRLILYTIHAMLWAAGRIADVDESIIDENLGKQNYERYQKFVDLTMLEKLL